MLLVSLIKQKVGPSVTGDRSMSGVEECGRLSNGPPDMPMTNLWNLGIVTLYGRRNFAGVIRLRIMRCFPRLSWWAQQKCRVFIRGLQEGQSERSQYDDRDRDWSDNALKMEKGLQPGNNRWLLEAEKDKEVDFPLRASRKNQPCRHLDLSQ